MDIKRAKEEICNTVRAYLAKDIDGEYQIPVIHQRPVLLIGPPGIGKTAIMEQAARECGINLVSYSITHHTRQSAIGLPYIEKKQFDGREYSVTEYTISEIIAALYEKAEATGIREGILFLDEINCVSETLAPAMLQFLQAKTFGTHRVPDGWVIVAAGNPPEYNKSVREFDIVTLDRVKRINVEENYRIWKEYALANGIHGAIPAYLDIKPENFYRIQTTVDGKEFVTARGWEDLSRLILAYEKLQIPVDQQVIVQYLQHTAIAKDFAAYLELYYLYEAEYHVDEILQGHISARVMERIQKSAFDERLSVESLLLDKLCGMCRAFYRQDRLTTGLYEILKRAKQTLTQESPEPLFQFFEKEAEKLEQSRSAKKKAGLLTKEEHQEQSRLIRILSEYGAGLKEQGPMSGQEEAFIWVKEQFAAQTGMRTRLQEQAADALEYAFDFMEAAFGVGQEMVIFVTELTMRRESLDFIKENGCERYYTYNQELLLVEKRSQLLDDLTNAE